MCMLPLAARSYVLHQSCGVKVQEDIQMTTSPLAYCYDQCPS